MIEFNLGKLIWITGLSGSGKTTIGREVYNKIKKKYSNTIFLDGDNFREIFGNDLKYNVQDRLENARRMHKICKFLVNQNINVICSTMSLFKEIHDLNKKNISNYYEIFIECEINELIKRDQKGLYSKALKEKKNDVVGINFSYDKPVNPNLIIDNTKKDNIKKKNEKILNLIKK